MEKDSNDILVWRVHPVRERVGAAFFAVVVIAAMAWLATELMQNFWWGVFAFVIPTVSLNRFFLPSEYRIDESGVTVRTVLKLKQLRWNEIRRFLHDGRGGYLSSRSKDSFLESFRGIHLLFSENGDDAITHIRQYMNREGKTVCN